MAREAGNEGFQLMFSAIRPVESIWQLAHVYCWSLSSVLSRLMVLFFLLWCVVCVAMLQSSPEVTKWAGFAVAAGIGGGALWAAIVLVIRFRPLLCSPVPLMLVFISLYFGFGPWFHINEEEVLSKYGARLFVDEVAFLRVQVLNLAGLTSLVSGILLAVSISRRRVARKASSAQVFLRLRDSQQSLMLNYSTASFSNKLLQQGWLFFFGVAVSTRFAKWFLGVDVVELLPGFLGLVDKFGWVAALLGGIVAGRKGRGWWFLVVAPVGLELIEGAILLRKSMMLLPILLSIVGVFLAGKSIRVLVLGGVCLIFLYIALKPITDTGRDHVWTNQAMSTTQFYSGVLTGTIAKDTLTSRHKLGWWSRLNYTPVQASLMRAYDTGRPGNTFADIHWMFVPRFLSMGNKPILDFGARTTMVVFGHAYSSTGPTLAGEAYWNGGWLLVVFACGLSGIIFYAIGFLTLSVMLERRVLAWPIALMGILTGQLVSNFFTSGLIGTAVIFFILVLLFRWSSRRRRSVQSNLPILAPFDHYQY